MSIEAMKLAAEFNRYFTSGNGVDVPAKVSVSRDEWRALLTAIQQAEAQQPATGEPSKDEAKRLIDTLRTDASGGRAATVHELDAAADLIEASLSATGEPVVPDGVWEALQRLIENGFQLGPASADDSLLVARYRKSLLNTHPAPSVPADVVLTIHELREIQRAVDDFSDCGETDVPDRILMRGVMAGYLECTNYMVVDRDGLRDAAK